METIENTTYNFHIGQSFYEDISPFSKRLFISTDCRSKQVFSRIPFQEEQCPQQVLGSTTHRKGILSTLSPCFSSGPRRTAKELPITSILESQTGRCAICDLIPDAEEQVRVDNILLTTSHDETQSANNHK